MAGAARVAAAPRPRRRALRATDGLYHVLEASSAQAALSKAAPHKKTKYYDTAPGRPESDVAHGAMAAAHAAATAAAAAPQRCRRERGARQAQVDKCAVSGVISLPRGRGAYSPATKATEAVHCKGNDCNSAHSPATKGDRSRNFTLCS